jgi:carbamoyl-phosphate synthase large subunit
MACLTVLVTGAGSQTGTALVRSLVDRGHYVIGADPSPYAVGRQMAHRSEAMPWANDPEIGGWYRGWHSSVDAAVLVTTAEIWAVFEAGLPTWACSPEAVDVCEDKLTFATAMAVAGIPHPTTADGVLAGVGPWIVKPRWGEGSKDTFRVDRQATVAALVEEFPHMIVQPVLPGLEWEVDVFARDGDVAGGVAFWKHRIKGGTTVAAETFDLDLVRPTVRRVVAACGLDGPLNIGGFYHEGVTTILEVNPRFSHGYLIAEAAGGNPLEYFMRVVTGQPADVRLLDCRPGVRFDRFWRHQVAPAVPATRP